MDYVTDPGHLVALAATLLLGVALITAARRGRLWVNVAAKLLGLALVLNEVVYVGVNVVAGRFTAMHSLPLYLCDVAAFVAGAALWWRRSIAVEVTYFWGLAGCLQGLLTPDSYLRFASYGYFQYYIDHCGMVVAALLLVAGFRVPIRSGAVVRVFALTLAFTVAVGICDVVTGGNYMYLRDKPAAGSLLSVLGPWPWYMGSAAIVAVIFLFVLDLPLRQLRTHSSQEVVSHG